MRLTVSALFLILFLLGCSSPKTSYYRMSSSPISAAPSIGEKVRLMVGPVSIPASMDRPQIVTQSGSTEVQVHEYHRWAGTLRGDIGQVISSRLAQDLGTSEVWNFSQSTQAQFDYQILVDVQNLDSSDKGGVILDVLWTIKPSAQNMALEQAKKMSKNVANVNANHQCKNGALTGRSVVSEAMSGSGFDAMVAAQSRAFSKVGDEIAKRFTAEGCRP